MGGHPRISSRSLVLCGLLIAGTALPLHAITQQDYFQSSYGKGDILRQGDSEFEMIKLEPPMPFFSQNFDHIYINTNGILTFSGEYSNFVNFPFPIEYPAIAPFYANIDTTRTADFADGTISYFQSQDPEDLEKGTQLIRDRFEDAADFTAQSVFVVTWSNVGYFNQKTDLLNSFQVVLIWSNEDAFAQFLYPQGGINWVQAETGDSGLPDVRAQAGFVSEDGRFYLLRGSGTENVRFLTDTSNVGVPGKWLFRVGPLAYEENIDDPGADDAEEAGAEESCAVSGRMKCHVKSTCEDQPAEGFCCTCDAGYYGNGYNCLKNDSPLRVTGSVKGTVNNLEINGQFQSYVILVDGRSYSALSPLPSEIGHLFQLVPNLGESVGWLFARTADGRQNGYQLTGGVFNKTTSIRFETGETLQIKYEFKGLNVWDQLTVDMEIFGQIKEVAHGAKIRVPDVVNTYRLEGNNVLSTQSDRYVEVGDQQRLHFTISEEIRFESCPYKALDLINNQLMERVFKTSISYEPRDNALRVNMLNKVGDFQEGVNPCNEGAVCGENSLCVPAPSSEIGYECQCKNGFTFGGVQSGISYCVDIDECASPSDNICNENAECINVAGGYACACRSGYQGNGYQCTPEQEEVYHDNRERQPEPISPSTPAPQSAEEVTDDCTDDSCNYVPPEDAPEPVCDTEGCVCPSGYRVMEYGYSVKCERDDAMPEDHLSSRFRDDRASCDIENNCHANANCEWTEEEQRFQCICVPGFDGDGYVCEEKPTACVEDSNCDIHAACQYDYKSASRICVCENGYVGDGRTCQLPPECHTDGDCGVNSWCEEGICSCRDGFERDLSDFCVPAGSCGGAYCAENAICQYDSTQQVSYCLCPKEFVGDGVRSCKSVPPPCNVRNNCGLNAICAPSYRQDQGPQYECQCNPGYYGDGFVCTLQVNCANTPSLCDREATCSGSINGPICTCNAGFRGNGTVCTPVPKYDDGFLLISQGVAVVRVPFDGRPGRPTSMSQMAISISRDCTTGRVYWSDISATCIYSSNYDGTDKKIFTCDDVISPEGLAVDWISRRLYWTDSSKDIIEVANLDDPRQRAVLISKGLVNPRGIAVDPHANKIYWSDWNRENPKIETANLDGTDREVLLSSPAVKLPNSLDINPSTGEVCFADAGNGQIGCYDSYTRSVRTVVSGLAYPFGLAISHDNFYWTDWTTRKIEVADRDGVRKAALAGPLFGAHKMYGMAAVTEVCTHYHSHCLIDNGGCPADHLCIPNPRAPAGRACLCANESCLT